MATFLEKFKIIFKNQIIIIMKANNLVYPQNSDASNNCQAQIVAKTSTCFELLWMQKFIILGQNILAS